MEFQVTGRESFKTERPSRPVKIAESDADVSESSKSTLFICLFLFFKISISDFLQSTTERQLTLLCVLVWFVYVCVLKLW